ncbi:MAG: hypothetical protein WC476_00710 [Phycisphaerae bacterium]|jgi:rRNA maturation endonuclease Nob1
MKKPIAAAVLFSLVFTTAASAESLPQIEKMDTRQLALLVSILVVVNIIILVTIVRWVFRINTIVALLKNILSAINPQNLISTELPPLKQCDGCSRNFEETHLKKIASGQLLCPECTETFKDRRA